MPGNSPSWPECGARGTSKFRGHRKCIKHTAYIGGTKTSRMGHGPCLASSLLVLPLIQVWKTVVDHQKPLDSRLCSRSYSRSLLRPQGGHSPDSPPGESS